MAGTIRGLGLARFCPLTQVLKPAWLPTHEQEQVGVLGSGAGSRDTPSRQRCWAGTVQALVSCSSARSSDMLLRSWLLFFYEPVV